MKLTKEYDPDIIPEKRNIIKFDFKGEASLPEEYYPDIEEKYKKYLHLTSFHPLGYEDDEIGIRIKYHDDEHLITTNFVVLNDITTEKRLKKSINIAVDELLKTLKESYNAD